MAVGTRTALRLVVPLLAAAGAAGARASRVAAGRAAKGAAASSSVAKGFGAARTSARAVKRWADRPASDDDPIERALDALEQSGGLGIEAYLNPALTDDPALLADAGRRLRANEVVVLRDAFRPEFAEAVHRELSAKAAPWSLNEEWFADGYAYRHHNVYSTGLWSHRLNKTFAVFDSAETKAWMEAFTARDCSGPALGSPSHYRAGDHSLPHTDWTGQRTIAYVWHLSKDWRPEWGGALYWAQNDHAVATYPASFNTLVLFSVTPTSAHFVTTVSPQAKQKRLAFNGWWQSSWVPTAADDLEAVLADAAAKQTLTHRQLLELGDLLKWGNLPAERRAALTELQQGLVRELFPRGEAQLG